MAPTPTPTLRISEAGANLPIPAHFRCPISLDLMTDPVTLPTYERRSIETWLDAAGSNRTRCPVTNQLLAPSSDLTPNHAIRRMIQDWCVANKPMHGVDRIPTPRAPETPHRGASEMLIDAERASSRRERARFVDTIASVRGLAKESERNRRCISSNGRFAGDEAVSALACLLPLGDEACREIVGSTEALRSLVSVLRHSGDSAGRLGAVLVVRELVLDGERAAAVSEAEGLVEAIAEVIKEPISPRATKASLVAAYYLASASGRARSRLVQSGAVPLLLEILVGSEKSACEKALGVLDVILGDESAREEACEHALAVPVLVKRMFRVSEAATEFAVSGLWKLCCGRRSGDDDDGERRRKVGLARDALSVGAFQKLLLLLQVGCRKGTKEKASELLRMLNGCRGGAEGDCVESADFRGIKRSF